ncbi:MAG: pyruvate carboxylase, partial [Candidatus Electrothrix sp. AS4_5]|nr:pyruvate carboxylase [Candidatus Electrothrix gigas]
QDWKTILEEEGGIDDIEDMDIEQERETLTERLGCEPTEQQLVTYLQHPNDAVNFFKFEEKFGKSYVLPPSIFLRQGGFDLGESISFRDHSGKEHMLEVGPVQKNDDGETNVYLNVDHHERVYVFEPEAVKGIQAVVSLSKEEIEKLAAAGDIRAPFAGNVSAINVKEGQEIGKGEQVMVLEAMKMQTPLLAEVAGVVKTVSTKVGDALQPGDKLLKIEANEE